MDFRSHLARSFDFRSATNLTLAGLVLAALGVAVVRWLNGAAGEVFLAPVFVFVIWALLREIDPDHPWVALATGAVAGVWVLADRPVLSALAAGGLVVAARIITSTTGRRPLPIDLIAVTVLGIGIAFTVEGWLAGFAIAVAVYIDDRMRAEKRLGALAAAVITAVGATLVATATRAFPDGPPDIVEYLALLSGVIAVILLVRDPAPPISQVDARHAAFIDKARLHISRSVVGVAAFLMVLTMGSAAEDAIVIVVALAVVIVTNEIELLRRRDR
ncbi:MAG TPA: hypothetical protein VFO17_05095 [Acidimicrobiia bacterium]|jgi:hypothetical protein|nr:hypothetical protein [Acidimicrobiia bacterium]